MPALNYQAWKARSVESGECRQTIRAYRKDGRDPRPGETLYHFWGMRTKKCRRLLVAVCTEVIPIQIVSKHLIRLNGKPLDLGDRIHLAGLDGFALLSEMFAWFEEHHGLPFDGLVIRW